MACKILSLFSLLHACALAELSHKESLHFCAMHGLDARETQIINDPRTLNKTFLVYSWIISAITKRFQEGGLAVPAPIASRVWDELARGMLALRDATSIHDTPFPFAFAQLCSLLIGVIALAMPLACVHYLSGWFFPPVMAFIAMMYFTAMNEVCVELEDPFGDDPNDLPMKHYQYEFNNCLMICGMLGYKKWRPPGLDKDVAKLYMSPLYHTSANNRKLKKKKGLEQRCRMMAEGWDDICNILHANPLDCNSKVEPVEIDARLETTIVRCGIPQAIRKVLLTRPKVQVKVDEETSEASSISEPLRKPYLHKTACGIVDLPQLDSSYTFEHTSWYRNPLGKEKTAKTGKPWLSIEAASKRPITSPAQTPKSACGFVELPEIRLPDIRQEAELRPATRAALPGVLL